MKTLIYWIQKEQKFILGVSKYGKTTKYAHLYESADLWFLHIKMRFHNDRGQQKALWCASYGTN